MISSLARARRQTAPCTPRQPIASAYDLALIAILDRPVSAAQTYAIAFAHKELELRAAIAALSLADTRALLRRLTIPQADDDLVHRLARLTSERRARLIAFVADAPRRAAHAVAVR
jgi:hypothetical protein